MSTESRTSGSKNEIVSKNIEAKPATDESSGKAVALREVSDRFGVVETITALRGMMTEVTKKEITPDTVNAACNAVQNINLTIRTAIQAAKYLSEK